jgi:hypothetical protein
MLGQLVDLLPRITKENEILKQWRCEQSELAESFEVFSQSWICLKFVNWTGIDGLVV